jgi:hypothetical protein
MDSYSPIVYRVASKFHPKETKAHKVDKMAEVIRSSTGLSKGMSEAIADAIVRGREVERLALQKNWPIVEGTIEGPKGTIPLPTT